MILLHLATKKGTCSNSVNAIKDFTMKPNGEAGMIENRVCDFFEVQISKEHFYNREEQ